MRLVHEPAGETRAQILATTVEIADSMRSLVRGLRGRRTLPDGHAMVLDVAAGSLLGAGPRRTTVDMLFVRVPIDAVWVVDETVVTTKRLAPWWGIGSARADTVVELPAGGADAVSAGDAVRLEDDGGNRGRVG